MTGSELLALDDDAFSAQWRAMSVEDRSANAAGFTRYRKLHDYVADGIDRLRREQERAEKTEKDAEGKPRSYSANDLRERVEKLWLDGLPSGSKTGWPSVDKNYTVLPGQLSIVTGWPGAGKSEWLDALMINLTRQSWKFSVFSAENMPGEFHIQKLMEKLAGAPFGIGRTERIPFDEIGEWCDEISTSIKFMSHADAPTMRALLIESEKWLLPDDCRSRGLIVDPWNQLDHFRGFGMNETEFIRDTLNQVRNWARANNVHVWIVAHPQKMAREGGKLPVPRPDMISGSQHWWNVADCALAIWRDPDKPASRDVEVHVQKVRFKHIGSPGIVSLDYDRVTGKYSEKQQPNLYAVGKDGE